MTRKPAKWYLDPVVLAWIHVGHTLFWVAFLVPLFLWWTDSIALLQFISVWALVTSGLGGVQAALAQRETHEQGETS